MNTTTGEIREYKDDDIPNKGEVRISQIERQYLEMFEKEERPEIYKQMRSKNNAAKRRARKLIAKQSQRRNRK